jgi:hypothetical protein
LKFKNLLQYAFFTQYFYTVTGAYLSEDTTSIIIEYGVRSFPDNTLVNSDGENPLTKDTPSLLN